MKFTIAATAVFVAIAGLLPSVIADVWDPPVLDPTIGTIWFAGSTHNVTWDTSNPPAEITNPIGTIILRTQEGRANPVTPVTLATGFNLHVGTQAVTIPSNAIARGDYVVVLIGDSGNESNPFVID